MSYQDQAGRIAEEVGAQVAAAFTAYLAGTMTAEAFLAVVAAYLAAGNQAAASLGDLALAAAVTTATGYPEAPVGVVRPLDEPDRLTRAATTILDDLDPTDQAIVDTAQMRYQRLVASEVRKATADAYSAALGASRRVTGWTRGLEPDACQLCRWWARDGRIWPADHPIPRHQGCDCSQLVVTTTEPIKRVRYH